MESTGIKEGRKSQGKKYYNLCTRDELMSEVVFVSESVSETDSDTDTRFLDRLLWRFETVHIHTFGPSTSTH